jgi:hypothetical protein
MQILHPFAGSVQQYIEQLAIPDSYRPGHCPQCRPNIHSPRTASTRAHSSTLLSTASSACAATCAKACRRTVSLLPEFALALSALQHVVIALFLITRLLLGKR